MPAGLSEMFLGSSFQPEDGNFHTAVRADTNTGNPNQGLFQEPILVLPYVWRPACEWFRIDSKNNNPTLSVACATAILVVVCSLLIIFRIRTVQQLSFLAHVPHG
jgi:hypothetical protein